MKKVEKIEGLREALAKLETANTMPGPVSRASESIVSPDAMTLDILNDSKAFSRILRIRFKLLKDSRKEELTSGFQECAAILQALPNQPIRVSYLFYNGDVEDAFWAIVFSEQNAPVGVFQMDSKNSNAVVPSEKPFSAED